MMILSMKTILLFFLALSSISGLFIYYLKDYVIYCLKDYDPLQSAYTIRRHDYHQLCKELFIFEGNNNIFPKIINYFHSIFFDIDKYKQELMDINQWYNNKQVNDIKASLIVLKYSYMILYISGLVPNWF